MERFGNLEGDLTANYSIFGGQLDGHKGSVTIGEGISEMDFGIELPSNPLPGDSCKLSVEIGDVEGRVLTVPYAEIGENFYFWRKFLVLAKIFIFGENFDFCPKCLIFDSKI